MTDKSGIVSLKPLYDFASLDQYNTAIEGRSKEGRKFGKLVKSLTAEISDQGGFYIWGSYDHKGLWQNIYIGKAGFNKTTSLRARIMEELKDERQFFWKAKLPENEILKLCDEYYPKMAHRYKTEWVRHFKKFNSTHIIWVSIESADREEFESEILVIESDIIETMNPKANINRPRPFGELQEHTIEIITRIKHNIHENRPEISFIPIEVV